MNPVPTITHEQFIERIVAAVRNGAESADRERLERCRIVYGAGQPGLRGVTYYDRWTRGEGDEVALVEICAFGEESPVQIAGTVIHELAHVVAGFNAGHGADWRKTCARLGLRGARAGGQNYMLAAFRSDLRCLVGNLGGPADGHPNGWPTIGGVPIRPAPRPCPMGIGTRGGKSRGKGSGSRLRKWTCECASPIVRCAGELDATCNNCGTAFKRTE